VTYRPSSACSAARPRRQGSSPCDNYGTHKTPAIKAWLARHPRFHMHLTPTGSSWINQVERWFGFLTEQKIRRGTHMSVHALEADIRSWIADWNTHPRPFIWDQNRRRDPRITRTIL
jgi:DDE superfamily endonuclease